MGNIISLSYSYGIRQNTYSLKDGHTSYLGSPYIYVNTNSDR